MKNVKVSVIMPTFNSARFIKDAVDSILSQTFQDFEFIIIDDASTDETLTILSGYAQKDKRIRIIKNERYAGLIFSLNRGIRECVGEYIARMDSDDIAINDKLEKQVAIMEADSDICALGGALSYIDASGNDLGIVRYCSLAKKDLLVRTPLLHPTVVIRRKVLLNAGISYDKKYPYAEDYHLWLQLGRYGKLSAISDVVLKYRLNSQAAKIRHLKSIIWDTLKVKKDAIIILKIKPSLKALLVIFMEFLLLLLPPRLVFSLYLKKIFKKGTRVNL